MSNFKDAGTISGWAVDAVAAAQELGLISGRGKELFMPHEKVNEQKVRKSSRDCLTRSINNMQRGKPGIKVVLSFAMMPAFSVSLKEHLTT